MALGLPGRFTISVLPRIPAVCRERIAVGTNAREVERICSPKPGSIFSQTAWVASGVTSLGEERFVRDAREPEEVLVHRAVVVVLADLPGKRGAGLVEQARKLGVAPQADARAAGRVLGQVR